MAYPGGYKYNFGVHTPSTEYRDNYDSPKKERGPRNTGELGRPSPASRVHLIDRTTTPVPMFQPVGSRYEDPAPIDWRKPSPHHYLQSPRPRSPAPRSKSPCLRSILRNRVPETSYTSYDDPYTYESYIERSLPKYESYVSRPPRESRVPPKFRSTYRSTSPVVFDRDVTSVGYDSWSTTKRYESGYDTVEVITPRPPPPRPYTAVTREPPRRTNNWVLDESPRRWVDDSPRKWVDDSPSRRWTDVGNSYDRQRNAELELLQLAKERMRDRDLLLRYGL